MFNVNAGIFECGCVESFRAVSILPVVDSSWNHVGLNNQGEIPIGMFNEPLIRADHLENQILPHKSHTKKIKSKYSVWLEHKVH